jgi:hypothetical protein
MKALLTTLLICAAPSLGIADTLGQIEVPSTLSVFSSGNSENVNSSVIMAVTISTDQDACILELPGGCAIQYTSALKQIQFPAGFSISVKPK